MRAKWLLAVALVALLAIPARAILGQDREAQRLAMKYGVGESEIRGLRVQGLAWGEVEHALAISLKSGRPVAEIMDLRNGGMDWREIAKKYGFTLDEAERRRHKKRGN